MEYIDDNHEKDKIDELLDLTKENNRILRKMHRGMVWGQVFSFLYWLIVLGALGWAYYQMEPYIDRYFGAFNNMMSILSSIEEKGKGIPSDLQNFLEKVR